MGNRLAVRQFPERHHPKPRQLIFFPLPLKSHLQAKKNCTTEIEIIVVIFYKYQDVNEKESLKGTDIGFEIVGTDFLAETCGCFHVCNVSG